MMDKFYILLLVEIFLVSDRIQMNEAQNPFAQFNPVTICEYDTNQQVRRSCAECFWKIEGDYITNWQGFISCVAAQPRQFSRCISDMEQNGMSIHSFSVTLALKMASCLKYYIADVKKQGSRSMEDLTVNRLNSVVTAAAPSPTQQGQQPASFVGGIATTSAQPSQNDLYQKSLEDALNEEKFRQVLQLATLRRLINMMDGQQKNTVSGQLDRCYKGPLRKSHAMEILKHRGKRDIQYHEGITLTSCELEQVTTKESLEAMKSAIETADFPLPSFIAKALQKPKT